MAALVISIRYNGHNTVTVSRIVGYKDRQSSELTFGGINPRMCILREIKQWSRINSNTFEHAIFPSLTANKQCRRINPQINPTRKKCFVQLYMFAEFSFK